MALKSPQGKNWTGLHVAVPHVFYHMVGDLHGMIIPFVELASTYNYNEAVKNNQRISAQAYADALYHARMHVLRLCMVFASGDLGKGPPHELIFIHQFGWHKKQHYTN
jgi:hypothetical protein